MVAQGANLRDKLAKITAYLVHTVTMLCEPVHLSRKWLHYRSSIIYTAVLAAIRIQPTALVTVPICPFENSVNRQKKKCT